MKNICFLNSTRFWGGGEKIHYDYSLKLRERGYNVHFAVSENSPLAQRASKAGFKTFNITLKNLSFLNPLKYWQIIRFFKKNEIEAVIISASHDTKVGAIGAKLAGVKRIVLYRALAAPVKNSFINRIIYGNVLTHIIANSKETRLKMLGTLNCISTEDVAIVYQGLDIQAIENLPVNKHDFGDGFIIGNAGRLTQQKGQFKFIEIAKALKQKGIQFKIVIAGIGELEESLRQKIETEQLNNEIELLGFVDDMNSFMYSIDVFALTSEWEGFGYVLAEAMIAKKPQVAFNITSNPELIEDGVNGYLVNFGDTTAFADRLATLSKDKALQTKMGGNGRTIVNKFELDQIMNDFENCLKLTSTKTSKVK